MRGALIEAAESTAELRVRTPGGHFQVRWDETCKATALGQLPFCAEFLEVAAQSAHWVAGCSLNDSGPNAPAVGDVLGTWLLSILGGHRPLSITAGAMAASARWILKRGAQHVLAVAAWHLRSSFG